MLFKFKVFIHQVLRYLKWIIWYSSLSRKQLNQKETSKYSHILFTHKSRLYKILKGVDKKLQENKVTSIMKAIEKLNGLKFVSNSRFSFWYTVGKPSHKKGFLEGLELRNGNFISTPGGGLCQITNMLYWTALNLGLTIYERHRHSYDLFPDNQRSVPFGCGATVFYNYRDLGLYNNCGQDLVLSFSIEKDYLVLNILSDKQLPYSIKIKEKDHRFYTKNGEKYRTNKLIEERIDHASGEKTTRILMENDCLVKY